MKLIADKRSREQNAGIIASFETIYNEAFPDADEREVFSDILDRASGLGQPHEPHTVIVLTPSNAAGGAVAGGLVADWYAKSGALHIIYLAVDPAVRKLGTGRKLIDEGLPEIIKYIKESHGCEIRNVFFESNNPLIASKDNFDKSLRLKIFARLGARVVNIPYVQPPLTEGKQEVDNLLLLTLPQFNAGGEKIPAAEIREFLLEFYEGLGFGERHPAFAKMSRALEEKEDADGNIATDPLSEGHVCEFSRASVTMHYIEDGVPRNPVAHVSRCNYFSSFETDLLNYKNQKRPPFFTRFRTYLREATLVFPASYRYTSEGASHVEITDRNNLKVNISISVSAICSTGVRIANLTLQPAGGEFFSELDLIKLATLFGSTQEAVSWSQEASVEVEGQGAFTFESLLARYGNAEATYKSLHTGIVQLDTSACVCKGEEGIDFEAFYKAFLNEAKVRPLDTGTTWFSKVLCGITLGIFDFERMNEEEIDDTIIPMLKHADSFAVTSRGNIVKTANEDFFGEIPANIIVSPYMLVPSMLLAYNEYVLNNASAVLESSIRGRHNVAGLERNLADIRTMHNSGYLTDVFQYPSEQEIMARADQQRSLTRTRESISERMIVLKELIDQKRASKSNFSDAILNSILAVIALMQIREMFINPFEFNFFYFIVLGAAVFIFSIVRLKHSNDKKHYE